MTYIKTFLCTLRNLLYAFSNRWYCAVEYFSLVQGGVGCQLLQTGSNSTFDHNGEMRRSEALLQTADLVVHHQEFPDLFRELALRLRKLADFETGQFLPHDSLKNVMRVHTSRGPLFTTTPDEVPIEDSTSGWVWLAAAPRSGGCAAGQASRSFLLREKGIRSYCTLPLTHRSKAVGGPWGSGSPRKDVYGENNLRLLRPDSRTGRAGG